MTTTPDVITVYADEGGEFRWTRQAPNNEIIGQSSEGYKAKEDALANIERTQGGEYSLNDLTVRHT